MATPAPAEVRALIRHPDFFKSPKDNDVTARQHAALIDKIFGLDFKSTENKLVARARSLIPNGGHEVWGPAIHEGRQTWVGLDPHTLNLHYEAFRKMLIQLQPGPGEVIADLGAGHGRLGMVLAGLFPRSHYYGEEYVLERVEEGQRMFERWGIKSAQLKVADLLAPAYRLPKAQYYFFYDYGKPEHIRFTLGQMEELTESWPCKVIAAGTATRSILEHELRWPRKGFKWTRFDRFHVYANHGD